MVLFTVEKKDGEIYSPTTLICIKSALYRHFLNIRGINIINDPEFNDANKTLKAVIAKYLSTNPKVSKSFQKYKTY